MKSKRFDLNSGNVTDLCLFLMHEMEKEPQDWIVLVQKYKRLESFEGFFHLEKLYRAMVSEGWITQKLDSDFLNETDVKTSGPTINETDKIGVVGLTFKGGTVLRHPKELNKFYMRHFSKAQQKGPYVKQHAGNKQAKIIANKKSAEAAPQKLKVKVENGSELASCLAQLPKKELGKLRQACEAGNANRTDQEKSWRQEVLSAITVEVRLRKKKTVDERQLKKKYEKQQKQDQKRAERAAENQRERSLYPESRKNILESLTQMENAKLLRLWRANTQRFVSLKAPRRNDCNAIIIGVEAEWSRRIKELPTDEAFKWPHTEVGDGIGGGDYARADESFLKILGYTVGKVEGLPDSTRHLILDRCFSGQLPPIEGHLAIRQWGDPKSALRLKKIAYHIAGLIKNFKKMSSGGYEVAISDWETDLRYLYSKYYIGHFGFDWPGRNT